ncbi:MAG: hypothetical protein COA45_06640 [Zetaproteobacteria bacterium]|nr:MAG: hypothetical protein COA45_06640 [Zetaproteobacteria bacterium]
MTNPHTISLRQLRQTIGRNIHEARRRKRLTLKKLSQRTNISSPKLDGFEIGKHELCFAHLITIAAALHVNVFDLIQQS